MSDAPDRNTLLALAERVEAADRPNRELDEVIAEIIEPGMFCRDEHGRLRKNIRGTVLAPEWDLWGAPAYTASLDAAMTLVKATDLVTMTGPAGKTYSARVWKHVGLARSFPLALTAAALRALAERN